MNFVDKRVFIAGGTGFIGGELVRHFVNLGAIVTAGHFTRPPDYKAENLQWFRGDLRDPRTCQTALENIDIAILAAASTQGASVIKNNPLAHVTPNILINTNFIDAASQSGVKKFAFISTGAIYPDGDEDHLFQEDEGFDGPPPDVYFGPAWMKRSMEALCQLHGDKLAKKMDCLVVRPSNVYGPRDKFDPESSHVTAALVRKVVERRMPIEVWGDGEDVRDLIYIDDFVKGFVSALAYCKGCYTVNLAAGEGYSVRSILDTICRNEGIFDYDVTLHPKGPSTIKKRLFNIDRARKDLNFSCNTSLDEGLMKTAEWYRKNQANAT